MKANGLYEEVLIAGFGGQGIILVGKLLAQAAMNAGKEVTYMPSYGAEVRGGTANCMVVVADEPVASPLVSRPDTLIAMNEASLQKFTGCIKPKGLLVFNSSLIGSKPQTDKTIELLAIPADDIALQLGNIKVANMVALGAYLQKRGLLSIDIAVESLASVIAERYHKTLPINSEALRRGGQFAKNNS